MTDCRDTISDVNFGFSHVVDAQVAMKWKNSGDFSTEWVVGVHNLFNRAYYQPFYDSLQPCRGLFTSLEVDF
jgi:outer membrane receptor protein involved in Fe transport